MGANFVFNPNNLERNIKIIKAVFIILITYYTNFKINNRKEKIDIRKAIIIIILSILCGILKYKSNHFISTMASVLVITFVYSMDDLQSGILTTIISMSINYMISILSIAVSFIIAAIMTIENNYINLVIIMISHLIILTVFFKIKKLKYGLSFLQNKKKNEYIDLFILNMCVMILFSTIIFANSNLLEGKGLTPGILLYVIIMFITIQKSLQLYYKQKILVKDLNETKEELSKKIKEVKELEIENISISKKSHTLAHKQKALEYKLEQIENKSQINVKEAEEVKDRLKQIEKDLYKEKIEIELSKTGIYQIDNMLEYMQAECKRNQIDFELQINGNIYFMINNLISKEDLETLLADLIKNAIIAINHIDNVNKSILVKLGEIEGTYSLYIYDSGIEFEKETLKNLGKKPSTTHKDEGGTGMGFMNTFDTLRKCEASLVIKQMGKPSKEDYTKVIIIRFDKKSEFLISNS